MSEPCVLPPMEAAEEAGLVYVSDREPGIKRVRSGTGFRYANPDGTPVKDPSVLQRIRSLAIPPAYANVWICVHENGHLQATGIDARGRKQYRYHPKFREVREESKFSKLADFAQVLPRIRDKVDADLSLPGMPRDKALAAVVYLLENSLIRIGNDEYARDNKHYGLTTMRNRHARVDGAQVTFTFLGKSGIRHAVKVHDRKMARIVRKMQDLPGQELFNYVDDNGICRDVTSTDVNAYLREITGGKFTAKDFRTWAATVLALTEFARRQVPATKKGGRMAVTEVMRLVSAQLGNTPSICRKCYVHPVVVEAYLDGRLPELLSQSAVATTEEADELAVARLLREGAASSSHGETRSGQAYVA